MRKVNWGTLIGIAASLLVAGYATTNLVGCSSPVSSSNRPSASQLQEGLTILDAHSPTAGVSAAYVKSGRVVYLETGVGLLKPEVYRQDMPNEPANEMDLRAVDQNNYTFFAQRGGDNFANPSWAQDIARSFAPVSSLADRTLDWAVAQEGAAAMAKALPTGFADHAFHLTAFATQRNPTTDPVLTQRLEAFWKASPGPVTGSTGDIHTEFTNSNGTFSANQWIQVYAEKASKGTLYVASHSGASMYANFGQGLGWQLQISACNHGTCPSSMSQDCYSWNGGSNIYTVGTTMTGEDQGSPTGNGDGTGGCQTSYSWDSGSGSHLCNDDAAYELYQTVHGTTNQSGWAITGQSSHCDGDFPACGQSPSNYACNCAGSACSGDWNTPNCGGAHL
jgi:hypothetical protein